MPRAISINLYRMESSESLGGACAPPIPNSGYVPRKIELTLQVGCRLDRLPRVGAPGIASLTL